TGSSRARAAPPRSSASTRVPSEAASRSSVFRAPLAKFRGGGEMSRRPRAIVIDRLRRPPQEIARCNRLHTKDYGQNEGTGVANGTRFAFSWRTDRRRRQACSRLHCSPEKAAYGRSNSKAKSSSPGSAPCVTPARDG